jgi:hypothetical protein
MPFAYRMAHAIRLSDGDCHSPIEWRMPFAYLMGLSDRVQWIPHLLGSWAVTSWASDVSDRQDPIIRTAAKEGHTAEQQGTPSAEQQGTPSAEQQAPLLGAPSARGTFPLGDCAIVCA